jgi:hypothetical protein
MRRQTLLGLSLLLLPAAVATAQDAPAPAGKAGVTRPADDAKPVAPPSAGPKSAAPS